LFEVILIEHPHQRKEDLMAVLTGEEYREGLKEMSPALYVRGEWNDDVATLFGRRGSDVGIPVSPAELGKRACGMEFWKMCRIIRILNY
jgi:hypothetical protein